ncbi:MAG TPA: hypothetical protein VF985_03745, partial [Mariniflexile sp.]
MNHIKNKFSLLLLIITGLNVQAQGYWSRLEDKEPTLGIAEVYQKFNTPHFQLKLVKASQTVAGLKPIKNLTFD